MMMRTGRIRTILIIAAYLKSYGAAPIAGPFDLIWRTAGQCPNIVLAKNSIRYENKIQTHSRHYRTAHMNVTSTVPIDDNLTGSLRFSVKTNQGWKDNFFNLEGGPFCSSIQRLAPLTFKQMMRQFHVKDCPIPPGYYPNVVMDMNITLLIDSLFYNDYKGRLIAKKNNLIVFCVECLFSVVPKKTYRKKISLVDK